MSKKGSVEFAFQQEPGECAPAIRLVTCISRDHHVLAIEKEFDESSAFESMLQYAVLDSGLEFGLVNNLKPIFAIHPAGGIIPDPDACRKVASTNPIAHEDARGTSWVRPISNRMGLLPETDSLTSEICLYSRSLVFRKLLRAMSDAIRKFVEEDPFTTRFHKNLEVLSGVRQGIERIARRAHPKGFLAERNALVEQILVDVLMFEVVSTDPTSDKVDHASIETRALAGMRDTQDSARLTPLTTILSRSTNDHSRTTSVTASISDRARSVPGRESRGHMA